MNKPRIFSLEEANNTLPALKEILERIFYLNDKINNSELLTKELFDDQKELKLQFKKINNMGCFLKDIEEGLIDFYYKLNGEIVHLCWKFGENEIRYWHGIEEGFAGRKSLRIAEMSIK